MTAPRPNLPAVMAWQRGPLGLKPVWTVQSDLQKVKETAHQALNLSENDFIEATFFNQGEWNKLYKIAVNGEKAHILRAIIPIYPHWKTEAEIGVMGFLQDRNTILAP
jgi:hypothetical protein